jgi:hypothetical protein
MLKRSSSHALGVTLIPTQSSSLTTFIPTSAFDSAVFDHAIGVTQTEGSPSAVSSGPNCSPKSPPLHDGLSNLISFRYFP